MTITYKGKIVPRAPQSGETGRVTKGPWRLLAVSGKRRYFVGSLVTTFNFGKTRLAVFRVPK
jgi:hypothetical protein